MGGMVGIQNDSSSMIPVTRKKHWLMGRMKHTAATPTTSIIPPATAKGLPNRSQRQPNLLKCVLAYPVFWSTFIPQCVRLLALVQTDLKVVYDLSTFDNTEQIRLDIDALKQDKQINIPHYNTLKDCDISFTRRFCEDTKSKWTARINSLRMLDKHDDSDKTTKINLSDLLELLYIRYKHSLPESLVVYDKSVTVEQKKAYGVVHSKSTTESVELVFILYVNTLKSSK